jgi:hypothetical protein
MKLVVGFLVILIAGGALLYYGGGYKSFNPTEIGEKARAAIVPGMSWSKVIDAAGDPKEYRVMVKQVRETDGQPTGFLEPSSRNPFDRKRFEERQKTGGLPDGFQFPYSFSNSVAFQVTFDGMGNVSSVDDLTTMADLLQTTGQECHE